MKLIFAYIRSYKNIHEQEFDLSDDYDVTFEDNKLSIWRMEMKGVKDILYGGNLIKDMHIVVGRTGAGKTNLLQMIGMDFHERLMSQSTDAYFMLYKCNDEEDSFAVEVFRNKGLVWQECSDIIDIIWILRQFDDKYFTQNHFHYPIIEIEEQDKRFNDLFERMAPYHESICNFYNRCCHCGQRKVVPAYIQQDENKRKLRCHNFKGSMSEKCLKCPDSVIGIGKYPW